MEHDLIPLGNRLTLRSIEAPMKIGKLWVPPAGEQNFTICQALILAVGAAVRDARLQPGQRVICRRFGRFQHDKQGKTWTVFECDVLALLALHPRPELPARNP